MMNEITSWKESVITSRDTIPEFACRGGGEDNRVTPQAELLVFRSRFEPAAPGHSRSVTTACQCFRSRAALSLFLRGYQVLLR
jgi:hypothetical protein